jgi:hypothetical protein
MPRYNEYGPWPASGEIDLSESRGNKNLTLNGLNIGAELSGSTLHFGPYWPLNGWQKAHFEKRLEPARGFDQDFHRFQLEWTAGKIYCKTVLARETLLCPLSWTESRPWLHPWTKIFRDLIGVLKICLALLMKKMFAMKPLVWTFNLWWPDSYTESLQWNQSWTKSSPWPTSWICKWIMPHSWKKFSVASFKNKKVVVGAFTKKTWNSM